MRRKSWVDSGAWGLSIFGRVAVIASLIYGQSFREFSRPAQIALLTEINGVMFSKLLLVLALFKWLVDYFFMQIFWAVYLFN